MGTVEHDTARHYAELDAQDREADAFAAWLTRDRIDEAISSLMADDKLTMLDLFVLTVESVCTGDLCHAAALREAANDAEAPRNLIAAQLLSAWEDHVAQQEQDAADDAAEDMALQRAGGYL